MVRLQIYGELSQFGKKDGTPTIGMATFKDQKGDFLADTEKPSKEDMAFFLGPLMHSAGIFLV